MKEKPTFEKVYQDYYYLLVKCVNSMKQPNIERNDLMQQAKVGMFLGLEYWDSEKGSLYNALEIYMKKELFNYVNQYGRMIRLPENVIYDKDRETLPTEYVISLDDTLPYDGSNEPLYSIIPIDETQYTEETIESIRASLNSLKPKYRKIIEMRSQGYSMDEIGAVFGLTKQAVSLQYNTAIKKIQEYYGINPGKIKQTRYYNSGRNKNK